MENSFGSVNWLGLWFAAGGWRRLPLVVQEATISSRVMNSLAWLLMLFVKIASALRSSCFALSSKDSTMGATTANSGPYEFGRLHIAPFLWATKQSAHFAASAPVTGSCSPEVAASVGSQPGTSQLVALKFAARAWPGFCAGPLII